MDTTTIVLLGGAAILVMLVLTSKKKDTTPTPPPSPYNQASHNPTAPPLDQLELPANFSDDKSLTFKLQNVDTKRYLNIGKSGSEGGYYATTYGTGNNLYLSPVLDADGKEEKGTYYIRNMAGNQYLFCSNGEQKYGCQFIDLTDQFSQAAVSNLWWQFEVIDGPNGIVYVKNVGTSAYLYDEWDTAWVWAWETNTAQNPRHKIIIYPPPAAA
jgi:hypothetical protein